MNETSSLLFKPLTRNHTFVVIFVLIIVILLFTNDTFDYSSIKKSEDSQWDLNENADRCSQPALLNVEYASPYLKNALFLDLHWSGKQVVRIVCARTVNNTAKGPKTYDEILTLIYEPFGYDYDNTTSKHCASNFMFPLKYKHLECSAVFSDWQYVQEKSNITVETLDPPPREIPKDLKDQYLLNGLSFYKDFYINEIPANLPKILSQPWTDLVKDKYFGWYKRSDWSLLPYGPECAALFFALKRYKPSEKTGLVIGSQTMWAEAMALFHGATQVTTVEYAPHTINIANMEYAHPVHVVKNWEKYSNMDFVISFSSIEHSGLARYGDPPDPIGDFREMRKILCFLKKGGLLYLGLPSGIDIVEYNAHRIYGFIRWPMIAAGFEFVDAFYLTEQLAYENLASMLNTATLKHIVLVLRKK